MRQNFRTPPVNVGDELDVQIEAVGEKGDGIAKKEGFVIFVPNTQQGQTVRVKVNKVLRKVAFGEVVGDASGPVESSSQDEQEDDMVEEDTAEDAESEPVSEDSEDFGMDDDEENKD
ncbi:TRAM domain-containing protein [Candidatus Woesearchaeota archaeon]|nr:TRAM domain-containing protein [Candidatus Woesearchaeota archaeon]